MRTEIRRFLDNILLALVMTTSMVILLTGIVMGIESIKQTIQLPTKEAATNTVAAPMVSTLVPTIVVEPAPSVANLEAHFQQFVLSETKLDFNKLPRPQNGELSIEAEGSMFWSRDRRLRIVFWKPDNSVDVNGIESKLDCHEGGTFIMHVDEWIHTDSWIYYDCDSGRIAVSPVPYYLGTPVVP